MKTHPNFVSWFGALQNVLRLVRMFSVYRSSNLHWSQPIPITMGTVEELDIKMQKVKVLEVVYKDKILKCIGLNTFRLHSNMTPILVFSFQVCHIFKIENQTNFCKNLNALSLLSYISPWKGNIYLWQLSQFGKYFPILLSNLVILNKLFHNADISRTVELLQVTSLVKVLFLIQSGSRLYINIINMSIGNIY